MKNESNSPRVWTKFVRKKSDGTVLKFKIQDIPSDTFETVMDFNINYFVKDETFHKAAGVDKRREAMNECRSFVSEMMKDDSVHIVICCLDDDSDNVEKLLGVSTVALMTKDDDDDINDLKLETKEMQRFFDVFGGVISMYDVIKSYDIDKYHDGRGIAVHPDYRGLGIATEFLKVRRLMCKEYNLPLTAAWMTAIGSQKAAERDGWETVFEVSYNDIAEKFDVTFVDPPPLCKLMVAEM